MNTSLYPSVTRTEEIESLPLSVQYLALFFLWALSLLCLVMLVYEICHLCKDVVCTTGRREEERSES